MVTSAYSRSRCDRQVPQEPFERGVHALVETGGEKIPRSAVGEGPAYLIGQPVLGQASLREILLVLGQIHGVVPAMHVQSIEAEVRGRALQPDMPLPGEADVVAALAQIPAERSMIELESSLYPTLRS